jgi:hypothetical protein
MSFNNLSKSKKREILNISIKSNEYMLYESLLRLGLDPSSFDIETFDIESLSLNSTSEEFIKNLSKSIQSLNFIKDELVSLEQS